MNKSVETFEDARESYDPPNWRSVTPPRPSLQWSMTTNKGLCYASPKCDISVVYSDCLSVCPQGDFPSVPPGLPQ